MGGGMGGIPYPQQRGDQGPSSSYFFENYVLENTLLRYFGTYMEEEIHTKVLKNFIKIICVIKINVIFINYKNNFYVHFVGVYLGLLGPGGSPR